ncbi:threonine aldolase family protein [Schleiferia thermophila]|jgi:threonine aldolase|uniref:L-threonine aldolase n=1 Tax=Schleiferia thermophila TaxID=884107 RepID=A0A368ZYZ3_9FLAO|nr:GntG family PLP-dependent aldolase [Schleiferia thermophila]KFD38655.1 threonine aldolase [Schleiferia thermophila str. Yellowstone]PMB22227.1 threonine aldolase [Fischerella thermalis CCMEE 5319]RCX02129.1 L-threonine aldolase [Schleiferia thermophila]GCD80649.1 threonine aldolase [Schleiferia thermophila]
MTTESIDLRSDTVTLPTVEMKKAMLEAPLGDDVIDKDPTTARLEQMAAEIWGFDAALFCPSGTMCNQIAIMVHTQPGDEVLCHRLSHIYWYEGGGIAANAHCSVRLLDGVRGMIAPGSLSQNINAADDHHARSSLLSLENTVNKAGGTCYAVSHIRKLSDEARRLGLKVHIDGARIYNALVAKGEKPSDYHGLADSMSICLSKGLGCPVGSLLMGDREFIAKARRIRKRLGGGMRQSGLLAAAGIYALTHHIERLADDHRRATDLATTLKKLDWVTEVIDPETNIIFFRTSADPIHVQKTLEKNGIRCIYMGQGWLRMVTHLNIDDHQIRQCVEILKGLKIENTFIQ